MKKDRAKKVLIRLTEEEKTNFKKWPKKTR